MDVRGGTLFCTLDGGPIHHKRVHPHALRHTFAWELELAGTLLVVISKLLGHSSVAVTSRYLAHLSNHEAVTALQAADLPPLRHVAEGLARWRWPLWEAAQAPTFGPARPSGPTLPV